MRAAQYLMATTIAITAMLVNPLLPGDFYAWATRRLANSIRSAGKEKPHLSQLIKKYGALPLAFEANVGQADSRVKFFSRGIGSALFLTSNTAVILLNKPDIGSYRPGEDSPLFLVTSPLPRGPESDLDAKSKGHVTKGTVLRMKLAGAAAAAEVSGLEEMPGKSNYLLGSDPTKWHTSVPNFSRVKVRDAYRGVDVVYYGNQDQLEYDFVVAPGADPNQITMEIETEMSGCSFMATGESEDASRNRKTKVKRMRIDGRGDLIIGSDGEEVRFHKPVGYQVSSARLNATGDIGQRTPVETHYVLTGRNQVRFHVDGYDRSRPLIIDPVLSYSTYLGGSSNDYGYSIAVDGSGNAYVTGYTLSANFPALHAFQPAKHGHWDAFVAELNESGTALVYSTFLGGSGDDYSEGIAVDGSGNAYVIGFTTSTNFPTAYPIQPTNHGAGDAFVAKLSAGGSALVYSTYLGGSGIDYGRSIAVDSAGNAYVTGYTSSTDFPTVNPLQPTNHGGPPWCPCDGFVAKINAAGSALVYSTYLGGNSDDGPHHIAVDGFGNAYVTGETYSTDFPTVNPIQATLHGVQDAFVSKLSADGSGLVYSTYLGGKQTDFGHGIAVDGSGNAYVTGYTNSSDFPTLNPLQANKGGGQDAFVAKLNATGSALLYSTYLGGSANDEGIGIAVDQSGNTYVTGYTLSADFPLANPLQTTNRGLADAFVAELNPDGSALTYSTYLGGSSNDYGYGVAVDVLGNVYVTGRTSSRDFPTADPIQTANHGHYDAFVAKLSPSLNGPTGR